MAKKDTTTTTFKTMGTEAAHARVGGDQNPNLKVVPKGGAGVGGSIPREKGAPGRTNVQTDDNRVPQSDERLGAKWAPQMVSSMPQAPEAALQGRNVRFLGSAVGDRDQFYTKRQYGQVQQ